MANNQYVNAIRITSKQERFINEYLRTFNATRAARVAGFRGSDNTLAVQAHRLLKHPLIKARLEQFIQLNNVDLASAVADRGGFTRKINNDVGFVYLIREPFGRIKIGKAVDVRQRLAVLNTGSPYELEVVAVIPSNNMRKLEIELQAKYTTKRVRLEWFELSDEDVLEVIQDYGASVDWETESIRA